MKDATENSWEFPEISENFIKMQSFSIILKKSWEFLRFTLFSITNSWESFTREKKACLQLLYKLSNTLVQLGTFIVTAWVCLIFAKTFDTLLLEDIHCISINKYETNVF